MNEICYCEVSNNIETDSYEQNIFIGVLNIVTCPIKSGIAESANISVAMQW
jgi:hypothetical protein